MTQPFIFGGNTGHSYEDIKRLREQAEALSQPGKNPGGVAGFGYGLSAIGRALIARAQQRRVAAMMSENRNAYNRYYHRLMTHGRSASYPLHPDPNGGQAAIENPQAPVLESTQGNPYDTHSTPDQDAAGNHWLPGHQPMQEGKKPGADIANGIIATAKQIGADPLDLANVISYETGGTFDPSIAGPKTPYGHHRGLIQFGEPQAQQYGVDWNNAVATQLGEQGAIARYLTDAGFKHGMGMNDLYAAVNAGKVGLYDNSDAANGGMPGSVRDKVNSPEMAQHRERARAFMAPYLMPTQEQPQEASISPVAPQPAAPWTSNLEAQQPEQPLMPTYQAASPQAGILPTPRLEQPQGSPMVLPQQPQAASGTWQRPTLGGAMQHIDPNLLHLAFDERFSPRQQMFSRALVQQSLQRQLEPKMVQDAAGYQHWANNGKRVFPGVDKYARSEEALRQAYLLKLAGSSRTNINNNMGHQATRLADGRIAYMDQYDKTSGSVPVYDPKNGSMAVVNVQGGKAQLAAETKVEKQQGQQLMLSKHTAIALGDINHAKELVNDKDFWVIPTTGAAGYFMSKIHGTKAYTLSKTLESLKASIGFDRLQEIRNASATGGALGPVSDKENELLQSAYGSLDIGLPAEQLKYNLDRYCAIAQHYLKGDLKNYIGEDGRLQDSIFSAGGEGTPSPGEGGGGGYTEADLEHTARVNNMTKTEVLKQLGH